ncbi:MAG TPA: Spy/CpxP family protein refolding chaperone [Steroidobacteraceae bacterium]
MSNKLHPLIVALALAGFAGSAFAQSAPDASQDGAGAPNAQETQGGAQHMHGPQDMREGWDRDRGRHCHDRWHHHHRHHGRLLLAGFRGLDLTDVQRQQMRDILAHARQQAAGARAGAAPGAAPRAAGMLALADPGDPGYAAAVQAAKKRAADRIQRLADLRQQLYNVLTPEQKKQLSKRVTDWKARLAQRAAAAKDAKDRPAPAGR